MIRVVVSPRDRTGLYDWIVRDPVVARGTSKEPLLDACRKLKSMGVDTHAEIAMFHKKDSETTAWSLKTTVGKGAALTVLDSKDNRGLRFVAYRPFDGLRR